MSDKDERTEDPTERRVAQARGDGQVFRSQEILSVGMLLISVTVLAFGTPWGIDRLKNIMSSLFMASNSTALNINSFQALAMSLGTQVVLVLLPLMAILMISGIMLNVLQSGWNFTFKPLMPKISKINPLTGFKRIFSIQGLFQFFKSLMKILIVLPIAYLHIVGLMEEVVVLHNQQMEAIFLIAGGWILTLFLKVIMVLVVLTIIDFAYEKWKFKEDLKMTKQEVSDERKQSDGDPKVKKERFRLALKILRRPRLDHAVMNADVVVTNPTHYAVALKYDSEVSPAPRVLIKGIRKRALRIRALALEKNIPIIENPPLARALYRSVSEEQEIPEELYPAVATILAAIYRKRKTRSFPSA